MSVTFEDYRNVQINPAVVAAALRLSRATEAVKRDPLYAKTVERYGPVRAGVLVAQYGADALSPGFQDNNPVEMDPSKQAKARLEVFHWAAGRMPGLPADAVQHRADAIWDALSAMDKAKLAGTPGSGDALIPTALTKGPGSFQPAPATADPAAGASDQGAAARRPSGAPWDHVAGASGGSAAYRDLPGSSNSFGPEKFTYTQMNDLARSLNVGWAMNQPDLLKLGPSALKDIANSGFKRDSYNLLAKGVGLKAKEIVGVAKLAEAKHFNADQFTKEGEPVIRENSDNPEDARDTWRKIGKWGYHPQDKKAEDDVRAKFQRMIEAHPDHADRIDHLAKKLKLHLKLHADAAAKKGADLAANTQVGAGTQAKIQKADDSGRKLAAVKAISPAATL